MTFKIGLIELQTKDPFARSHKVYDDIYHDYSRKNDNNEMFEEEEEEVQLENDDNLTISEAALQQQNQQPYAPPNPLFFKHNNE